MSSSNYCRRGVYTMLVLNGLAVGSVAHASPPPPVVDNCSALRVKDFSTLRSGQTTAATKVLSGTMEIGKKLTPAEREQINRRSRAMGASLGEGVSVLPDHCVVDGYVNPHINFQIRLPKAEEWNGKFLLSACDAWCGKVATDHTMAGVVRKYATMTTDGGHTGEHPFDGIWAMDNMQARIDFGYRANHVLLIAAKAIINEYYGVEPKYSYITGCSKGGQAGVMAASRYPNDFDGVIARGPTVNYTKVNVLRCGESYKATVSEDGEVLLGAEKKDLIQMAVMEHCDAKDGLRDGLISDPRKCAFDPATLACGAGDSGPHCLTPTEVKALGGLYEPVRDASGKQIYPATPVGSESSWPGWVLPVGGNVKTLASKCSGDYLKYFAFRQSPGADWDWRKGFNWDRDKDQLVEMSTVFDADTPDLTEFRNAGGKMIVVHGWSDSSIPAEATIEWYEKVSAFMGGRDKVTDFARLFLLPGVNHCDGGVGLTHYDALTALEAWVERNEAPQFLTTQRRVDGKVQRERPAYPYPLEARYKGRGDIDQASSFAPHDPRRK